MADQESTRDPAPESAPKEEKAQEKVANVSRMQSVMAWVEMRLGAKEAIKHMADSLDYTVRRKFLV